MSFAVRNSKGALVSLSLVAMAVVGSASLALASEAGLASPVVSADPQLAFNTTNLDPFPATAPSTGPSLMIGDDVVADAAAAPSPRELECLAKIVRHEAANQPREGQLAVAQLVVNRVESGRFASTVCGVAAQRGQFFDVDAYNPVHDYRWEIAVQVSRAALTKVGEDLSQGALFYQAAYAKATSFLQSRQRVATLGDHIFYR